MTSTVERRLSSALVTLFAVTAGSSAGCLYYLQPLLHEVGRDLHVQVAAAGTVVSAAQVGYLIGLALVVPLGDFVDRRRLVCGLLLGSCVALLGAAAAPQFAVLLALTACGGITAAAAQVVVPWASALAAPHERGAVVGRVMSGLLIGILGSRILSGLIAQVGGWRTVLVVAAAVQVLMAGAVWALSPRHDAVPGGTDSTNPGAPAATPSYPRALLSILTLIRREPVLRHRMVLGALSMAGFSVCWTALAFLLSGSHGAHYHYGDAAIGLFGLAGIAGALGAPVVGRLADRGHVGIATTVGWCIQLVGWALLLVGGHSVLVLILALLVFDLGVQGVQLCNQTAVYALAPDARSRITTAYMVAYFVGGVVGSSLGGAAYQVGGWAAVCGVGGVLALAGLGCWAWFARTPAPASRPDATAGAGELAPCSARPQ
ncbi:MFS transporter [Tsukamurella soli]|uniref:MFS transporter n=1 Tax=Tsukamurella soli TaxID=644556 RepID=A0ABP8J7J8_9ACTN